ncbi:MAG: prolipoprotein diacylglyceryl transferase [Bacteroidales bacterium]|jgi:prolipoprotein diacylglyceryl transferase|nr:prolipoprotein diacylglyceryl transferase [Bacteroidales bacterium]
MMGNILEMLQPAYITWDIGPEIFRAGVFSLRWYGLMFACAFVCGYYIMRMIFAREGVSQKKLDRLVWYMVIGTFVGARLGHCLFYESDYFLPRPLEILLPVARNAQGTLYFTGYQGLASHGAAIGILTALFLFSRKECLPYLQVLDRIAVVTALSGFFIRIGNLMNSEIYGTETSLPWGFIFVQMGETVPRHPTQIYEALSYLAIFILLCLLYVRTSAPQQPGKLFGVFLVLLFSVRFLIECIKENQVAFENEMMLNMGQILSIPLIVTGFFLLLRKKTLLIQK